MDPRSARRSPEADAADGEDWLHAGRVGRPHGLDGSFHVTRPRVALLTEGRELTIAGRTERIVRRAGTDARPILRLASCDSREAVEALRGSELLIPRAAAPPLEEDEWWPEEIEGCSVHDGDREVGVVRELRSLPSCDVLDVRRTDGGEDLLVPLIRDAVRTVDVAARRIDIDMTFLGEGDAPADAGSSDAPADAGDAPDDAGPAADSDDASSSDAPPA